MHVLRTGSLHASRRFRLVAAQIAVLGAGAMPGATTAQAADAAKLHFYQNRVVPVLQANCLRCHGGMNRRGGYSMATRALALEGSRHGTAIVPGRPQDSLLLRLIGPGPYPADLKPMPLNGRLTDAEITTLRQWVADGAVMEH